MSPRNILYQPHGYGFPASDKPLNAQKTTDTNTNTDTPVAPEGLLTIFLSSTLPIISMRNNHDSWEMQTHERVIGQNTHRDKKVLVLLLLLLLFVVGTVGVGAEKYREKVYTHKHKTRQRRNKEGRKAMTLHYGRRKAYLKKKCCVEADHSSSSSFSICIIHSFILVCFFFFFFFFFSAHPWLQ